MRRGSGAGQVLIIVALLSAVLVGIVGLSIDGGEVAGEQELVQASADGAALAAAYDASQGSTQASATALGTLVVQTNGLAAGSLTVSYLNSSGSIVAGPGTAGVATVQATVAETRQTFFLSALGIPTFRSTATAHASVSTAGASSPCAVCVLPASGVTYHQQQNSVVTITGAPLIVNSTSAGNLTMDKKSSLSAPSILLGSLTQILGPGASVTPNPTQGTAADPLAALGYPAVIGAQPNFSSGSGTVALTPGIYQNITITGGTVTMAGSYVVTGRLSISAGTLDATGALIFLGCSGYPTICPASTAGGVITASGGTVSLSAQTSGTYAGLSVFADRGNSGANSFASTALTVTGTFYTAGAALSLNNTSSTQNLNSEIVVASLNVSPSTTVAIAYSASQNATVLKQTALAP